MIRPVTCLCMLLAAGSGLYLYQAKHRAQMLDQEIGKTLRAADTNRERMRVLRAEYQLLQDPTRMADLATQHLMLSKTDSRQFVNWAVVERNYPVVVMPPPAAAEPPANEVDVPVASLALPAPQPAGPPAPPAFVARGEPRSATQTAANPAGGASATAPRTAQTASSGWVSTTPAPAPAQVRPGANPSNAMVASAGVASAGAAGAGAASPRSALGMARGEPVAIPYAAMRPAAQPVPQQVMLTMPRQSPYLTPAVSNAEAIARINRAGATSVPAAASSLGMARTLAPAIGSGWASNGNGG